MKESHDDKVDPLKSLEKTTILQETRCFDSQALNEQEIISVISKVLYLINNGEELTESESTELFFRVCKLYIVETTHIRKLLYLLLKELHTSEGEVFMITSSLSKDVTSSENPYFRAGALRVMGKILDPGALIQLERFIKNALVDSNDSVCSAAMITGIKLCRTHPEVVRRWITEVQDKLNSKNFNIHYHAMLLLYEMKKNDPIALSKLFENMMNANYRSPLAQTQVVRLIRYTVKRIPFDRNLIAAIEKFLIGCLKRRHDMVVFEAAKAILDMSELLEGYSVATALACLQLFLSSSKNTSKFAAIKTLNFYAIKHAAALYGSTSEFEPLLGESNRSLATMAISTLLKLSTEENVDRLLAQISNFISEITEDFKLELIESVKVLCLRMPQKYSALVTFVGGVLQEDGGFTLKKGIVNILLEILSDLPQAATEVLQVLAEFVEDCPFELLSCQLLHVLGEMGPRSPRPTRFIRFIYNRLILEKPVVRAAAISALGKFSVTVESARALLGKCIEDKDDEVRERAFYYLGKAESRTTHLPVSIGQLETALVQCQETGREFDFETAQHIQEQPEENKIILPERPVPSYGLMNIPGLAELGPPVKSMAAVALTDKNAEYVVSLVAHHYCAALVLEFSVTNTIQDQALENVLVQMNMEKTALGELTETEDGLEIYPCKRIESNASGQVWVKLRVLEGARSAQVPTKLKFKVLEYEGNEVVATFNDEYPVEHVHVELAAY